MSRPLACIAALAPLVAIASPAHAEEAPGLGDCTFMAEARCRYSMIAELGLGGGQTHSYLGTRAFFHGFAEAGFLFQMRGAPDLHIGPVFELAIETHEVAYGWTGSPRMRARYFAGGSAFVIEASVGPQYQRYVFHDGPESGTRVGVATDLTLGFSGIAAAWAQVGALRDFGGPAMDEVRWVAGVRANLLGWAAAVGALGKGW